MLSSARSKKSYFTCSFLIVLFVLLLLFSRGSHATGLNENTEFNSVLNKYYQNYRVNNNSNSSSFASSSTSYKILDKKGIDITKEFYDETAEYFNSGNLDDLMSYYYDTVGTFEQTIITRAQAERIVFHPGGELFLQPKTDMSRYVGAADPPYDWRLKINYNLKARMTYDTATNTLITASGPSLDGAIRFQSYLPGTAPGQYKTVYFVNQASGGNVSTNRTSATFTFAFDVTAQFAIWNSGDWIDTIDFGRHQYSFSASL